MCGALTVAGATVHAAKYLHKMLLKNIMRSPMSFFDVTPTGRIVNRFSKDIDTVDVMLPTNFRSWIGCFIAVSATHLIILFSSSISVWHYVSHDQQKSVQKYLLHISLKHILLCSEKM